MNKNFENNDFEKVCKEKQNSLASRIRIGFGVKFPVLKQHFVKIKEAEYSTDFEFFLKYQVHVIICKNNNCPICSSIEKRAFQEDVNLSDDASVLN